MFRLKRLMKTLLFLVMLAVILIEWISIFLTSFRGAIFNILSGIVFLTPLAAWAIIHEPWMEVIKYMWD